MTGGGQGHADTRHPNGSGGTAPGWIALCPAGVGFVYLILLILMLIAAPAGGGDYAVWCTMILFVLLTTAEIGLSAARIIVNCIRRIRALEEKVAELEKIKAG